jgi:hypothetical protein
MMRAFLTAETVLLLCTLMIAATTASAQISCPQPYSPGPPTVQGQRVFCGEVRADLRAVGFHSRPAGANPNSVTNVSAPLAIPGAPAGIYRLVNFNITENGVTRVKALSTMFPDACSQAAVLAAIRNAAKGAAPSGQFRGTSGSACQAGNPPAPFNIVGFTNANGDVMTAYPNY